MTWVTEAMRGFHSTKLSTSDLSCTWERQEVLALLQPWKSPSLRLSELRQGSRSLAFDVIFLHENGTCAHSRTICNLPL